MNKACYIFPGQGAQYIGMGRELYDSYPESKKVFDDAEDILPEVKIKKLCFEGPIEELTRTANSQVCIFVASMAALRALGSMNDRQGLDVVACAGLSLGELTALAASSSISFSSAVRLVRRRGELMEKASQKNPGSMASIIGLSLEDLSIVCKESGAEIANLNCPGQIVISGAKEYVDKAMSLAKEKGAKKAIALNVSGGFHSSLMKEAAELLRLELDRVNFLSPEIDVVSNVTADYAKTPEEIKENLVKQLYSPVRWEESVKKIASSGVNTFFEIGPGKILKGLMRRIDADLKVYNIDKAQDLDLENIQ